MPALLYALSAFLSALSAAFFGLSALIDSGLEVYRELRQSAPSAQTQVVKELAPLSYQVEVLHGQFREHMDAQYQLELQLELLSRYDGY